MLDQILEKDLVPDWLIRIGIRSLLAQRLRMENKGSQEAQKKHLLQLLEQMKSSPIAIHTTDANTQHYEVPSRFFNLVLGKHLKYSSGYWEKEIERLDEAEERMLKLTCERAQVRNGQEILELGCGWGSLSLYLAERYPQLKLTSVSNSRTQKEYIHSEIKKRGLSNLTVITCDMNTFAIPQKFDRVISVEMFEHMRNYEKLLQKISGWLKPDGLLFIHIFTHCKYTYFFDNHSGESGLSDWMSRYFFTGGMMPSDDLLFHFQDGLKIENHWQVSGIHYSETAETWLRNMDENESEIKQIFAQVYGKDQMTRWWVYWRIFFMACAELWGYKNGTEWMVSHYTFKNSTAGYC